MLRIKHNYCSKTAPKLFCGCSKEAGFTFIEVVVAVVITGIVVASVFSVIQGTVADHILASSQLQAAYLAQERIELVRNQRDVNWLQGLSWAANETDLVSMSSPPSESLGRFTRNTTVSSAGPNFVRVVVSVTWEDRRGSHNIDVETKLYDWFQI